MTILFTLLVAVIGLLMYALCTNPKLVEVGRIMFWTGLLAFLLGGASATLFRQYQCTNHAEMPEEVHKRSWMLEVGKQIASVVAGVAIAAFFLGGARQKIAQKVTTLESEMAVLKDERKSELKHITVMDLEGSVATKNFIANYEKKQATQDATIKEIQGEVRHLELMKAQIDRMERKLGDPPRK